MSNARRFIDAYNRVDRCLEGQISGRDYLSFTVRVRDSKRVPPPDKEKLADYAKLRNSIVHTTGSHVDDPIAEPRIEVVEDFEKIADRLERPPKVFSAMPHQEVAVLEEDQDVHDFLTLVQEQSFSQVPVRTKENGLKLVTTNTVTRWISSEYKKLDGAALEHATLGEVLWHSEKGDNIVMGSREMTVIQAWRIFAGLEKNEPPQAIVITHSGKESEKILKMVVRADLPNLLKKIF